MFNQGDLVTYSTSGVCKAGKSVTQNIGGKQREYYCLYPFDKPSNRILVPVDNAKLKEKIRSVPSSSQLQELFDNAEKFCFDWQENDVKRNEEFLSVIELGDTVKLFGVIGCLVKKKAELTSSSRHLKTADNSALKVAERMFCSCVSAVFEISFEEAVEKTEKVFF